MSEQAPLPFDDFLDLIDKRDRRELAEAAREAIVDHKQMRFATGWLRDIGIGPEVDPDELTYYRRERVEIAHELEIHGNPRLVTEILQRYETQYVEGTHHHGEA